MFRSGHHAVLPDEGMGPVAVGKLGAPHHLALVVNAFGEGGKVPRQSAEVCDFEVLPKSAIDGCAVSANDLANNLALVVNADGQGGPALRGQEAGWQCHFPKGRREALRCRFPSSLQPGLDC